MNGMKEMKATQKRSLIPSSLHFSIGTLCLLLLAGCSLIDDTLEDRAKEYEIDYELCLVTNFTTELHTQLGLETDSSLAADLREHLKNIFTDFAHDVDLSFYDTQGDSLRLYHDQHIMDANQQSYVLTLPMRQYMHLAVANVVDNPVVGLTNDERCHPSRLETMAGGGTPARTQADTISSHTTGLFSARLPMDVKEGVDQTFHVRLYMANCAAALVIDPRGHDISSLRVYTTGFASRFNICDSTYTFAQQSPIVQTSKVKTTGSEACYVSVNFPSREPKEQKAPAYSWGTRSVIETTEPFIAKEGDETLWQFKAYITKADGTTTETILSLRTPLRAGQLKIIRGFVTDEGAVQTNDHAVGVSVTLNWEEGLHHEISL